MIRAALIAMVMSIAAGPAAAQQTLPLTQLQQAAEAGNVSALMELARRHHDGIGVVQNFARAAELFERAAQTGNAEAQNQLGQYYHEGLGVTASRPFALKWLEAAAAQGAPQHLYDLASVLEASGATQDMARAAALYRQAMDAGLMDAAVSLGVLYQNGTGVPQDFTRAHDLYEAPAAQGHARAQNNLGLLYVRGQGVPQDYARAADLFAKAADQGLARAITNLGVMYENGFGVEQNDEQAARLYRLGGNSGAPGADASLPNAVYDRRLAALTGDSQAIARIQQSAQLGDPVSQFQFGWLLASQPQAGWAEWSTAAKLFRQGAEKGHGAAMANLGLLYHHGHGVPQDYVLGHMWLVLAGSVGFADAPALIATAQAKMTSGQVNDAQRRADAGWQALSDTGRLPENFRDFP